MEQQTIDAIMHELDHGDRYYLINLLNAHKRGQKWENRAGESFSIKKRDEKLTRLDLTRKETVTTGKVRIKARSFIIPTDRALAIHETLLAWQAETHAKNEADQLERYRRDNLMRAGPDFYAAIKPIMAKIKIGEPYTFTIDEITSLQVALAKAEQGSKQYEDVPD